jgi:hypothetical protein
MCAGCDEERRCGCGVFEDHHDQCEECGAMFCDNDPDPCDCP